ncbi:MAG: helix-turn-helix domain-containing protein [Campylobacter sp.]|uniref:helix-turn-helix domain-containing protein n=1 Tax=Campylobacter sp. TaxID=205 RepID=UPI001B0851CA|nr:helix-turn-helix domain-containing protein [Campylobacter sp.]MBO5063231.1 helix-turn-helix domain-containing protein [Campylobacter sp.]MBQ8609779.1 helix-turn-helix domain-containing protein [Campylobacter sp.]
MKDIQIQNKEWLTPKQLEAEFGITIGTQNKMRLRKNYENEQSIPFAKVGKRILYLRSDINEWLLSLRQGVK